MGEIRQGGGVRTARAGQAERINRQHQQEHDAGRQDAIAAAVREILKRPDELLNALERFVRKRNDGDALVYNAADLTDLQNRVTELEERVYDLENP